VFVIKRYCAFSKIKNYIKSSKNTGYLITKMDKIEIEFPDKSKKSYKKGITPIEIIKKDIGTGLAHAALAIKLDDEFLDLTRPLERGGKFRVLTFNDDEGKEIFRHSSSHILASAVLSLFPDALPTIGPAVEDGFYYDFDVKKSFSPKDLVKIEQKMHDIIKKNERFKRIELSKEKALNMFKKNPYKIELIKEFRDEKITAYKLGSFMDLCRGPHVPSTGKIKAFKLTKVAGAYWRGRAEEKQLQRIYGISFPEKRELKKHMDLLKEAEKRDHRKLSKELDLFSLHDEGPGFPFYHPKGMIIINLLKDFWRQEHNKAGYKEIQTPILLNKRLWEQSGHWDHYKENMYFTKIDDQDYAIKPMNCPGGILIYKERVHSYRELPLRVGEMGLVHRHELSGVLAGLFRLRCFTQDDAHIFMRPDQIKDEIIGVINLVDKFYKIFGFEYHVELSTRPEDAMGSLEQWNIAEKGLENALKAKKMKYKLNVGEGAFYGPKIDFHIKDCLGRTWQCATIQLDFAMPDKFDLFYIGEDGQKHKPVMIHRVIYGSLERFFGILIEHYAGKFPLWLSPVQVRILTVADRFNEYAEKVKNKFEEHLRVELDSRSESVSYKVREAQLAKINYILVVGEKEQKGNTVNVRTRDNKVLGPIKVGDFLKKALKEIEEKK